MPNRVKVKKLAKEGDGAEQAIMEARRALADQEDSATRSRARSDRKRSKVEKKIQQTNPLGPQREFG